LSAALASYRLNPAGPAIFPQINRLPKNFWLFRYDLLAPKQLPSNSLAASLPLRMLFDRGDEHSGVDGYRQHPYSPIRYIDLNFYSFLA